jgi:hypothetical protein
MRGGALVEKIRIIRLGRRRSGGRVAPENSGSGSDILAGQSVTICPRGGKSPDYGRRSLVMSKNVQEFVQE